MLLDALEKLSAAQAFTVDAVSTNTKDMGASSPSREVGTGEPLCIVIFVDVAATGGGVYEFQAIQSAAENLGSPDILAIIRPAEAAMVAGATFVLPIPAGSVTKRYLGLNFNNVSGTTGVTVTAYIQPVNMVQMTKNYAKNYPLT